MVDLPKNSTALEIAIASLVEDRLKLDADSVKITLTPAGAPDHILPYLAWQEHVDHWAEHYSKDQKLKIIQTAKQVHAAKGTVGALKLALNNLNIGAELEEWFNYGGEPYYFRINIRPDHGLSQAEYMHLFEVIDETKNLRSILDKVIAHFDVSGTVYAGGVPTMHHHLVLFPASIKPKKIYGNAYIGGGAAITEHIILQPKPLQDPVVTGGYFVGGAIKITENIYVRNQQ